MKVKLVTLNCLIRELSATIEVGPLCFSSHSTAASTNLSASGWYSTISLIVCFDETITSVFRCFHRVSLIDSALHSTCFLYTETMSITSQCERLTPNL